MYDYRSLLRAYHLRRISHHKDMPDTKNIGHVADTKKREGHNRVPLFFVYVSLLSVEKIALRVGWLVDFFVSLVATHFADSVLQHSVLLEEVVHRFLALCVVVHRSLEVEAEETLCATAACTCSKV